MAGHGTLNQSNRGGVVNYPRAWLLSLLVFAASGGPAGASDASSFFDSTTDADCVVTFNEVMYRPLPDDRRTEWIELFNQMNVDEDLGDWTLDGGIGFRFPKGTVIRAGACLVVAADPDWLRTETGLTEVYGPWTGSLANDGERLVLRNLNGRLMDELTYRDNPPWPVAADGSGASLAKRVGRSPSSAAGNWRASAEVGGTAGRANFPTDLIAEPETDTLLGSTSIGRWRVPLAEDAGTAWILPGFDDPLWSRGTNGFGFDRSGVVPMTPPARYYPLDGSAADASANEKHGVVRGGVSWIAQVPSVLAHSHQAARFDGQDSEVGFDSGPSPGAYTLSLWVRVEQVRSCSLLLLTSASGPLNDWSHQLRLRDDGRFEHYTWDGSPNIVTSLTVVQTGRWYHIAATAGNGQVARLYVNGAEEGTADPVGTLWGGGSQWVMGSNSGGTPARLLGALDDVAIWSEALPPERIAALAKGISPLHPGGLGGLFATDLGASLWQVNSTVWLRLPFTVPPFVSYDQITLRLRYDDGFAAWLDGVEIARRQAPENLSWQASATAERLPADAATPEPFDLTPWAARLGPGPHMLAVHGLNVAADDADFLIQAELTARRGAVTTGESTPIFSELPAAGTRPFWCELVNRSQQNLQLGQFVLRSSRGIDWLLPTTTLPPGGLAIVEIGESDLPIQAGDALFLVSSNGWAVTDGVRLSEFPQARRAKDLDGGFLRPSQSTPGAANLFALHDEIVINEILYHAPPTYRRPGTPSTIVRRLAIGWDSIWRFDQSSTNLDASWREPDFDGTAWASGPGILGARTGALAEPIRTPLQLGRWTYYFRIPFVLSVPDTGAELQLRTLVDDGAVFYVNGREVYRQKMPDGDVAYSTPAINVGDPPVVGPVSFRAPQLSAGTNWLAVEVHQWNLASSDVVCGAELTAGEIVTPGTPDTPFAENDEQWIELFNRADHPVDLGGWRLADAVDFVFPAGTVLEPAAYLVVARDADALRAEYPEVAVLGNFSGRLSHQSDRIALVDSTGNPADEVRYHDGPPWPRAADGGGSSLELRHPFADNAAPGAWAASEGSRQSSWRHYVFTQRAVEPVFGPPLNGFSELRLGLLDSGEFLIDNVSVIEEPNGTRRELIQNGAFETGSGTWRLLGNHSRSQVIDDPDRPGNHVLRVVAASARGYLHNQIETTLKVANAVIPVVAGRDYQIAFDARWLTGSPQVHTELYYNRVARTTLLDTPMHTGTPGRQNSCYSPNLGPTFTSLTHEPPVPRPGEQVIVSVNASDPEGIEALTLYYSVSEGPWQTLPMNPGLGDRFTATLPAQAASETVIQFYVQGRDSLGATATAPAAGPDSRALIRVDRRTPGNRRPAFHLILTAKDGRWLDDFGNMMSDDRLGATVVWDEREVYYDCGVHLHGSMFSRNNPDSAAYNVEFPADARFRGVHRTVQVKRRVIQEIIAKFVQTQSGVPGMYEDIVELFSHRPGNAGPARLSLAHYNEIYLGSQFANGKDGTLFNMEGIRVAEATHDQTPEGNKLPFPIGWVANYDISDLGDDPEQYRWSTMIRSNRAHDDYSPYIALAKVFSLPASALVQAAPKVMDVDEWMRLFALLSLFGIEDTYTQGNPHNLNLYARPEDGRILALPYDWDFFFARTAQAPLWGDQNLSRIIAQPVFTRLFYGNLLDLMETTFSVDYLTRWVAHFGAAAGEDYSYTLERVRDRGAYVRSRLPASIPFAITSPAGSELRVDTPVVTLEGQGWIDVQEVRCSPSGERLTLTWLDANRWRASVPLPQATNTVTLQAFNRRGQVVGEDTRVLITTGADESQRALLRVTELMYHPVPPSAAELAAGYTDANEFEYLEVANLGPAAVSLLGVRLTSGVEFDFTSSGITNLPAGGRVLVVSNPTAFSLRYGSGLPVAGRYAGNLDNGGEVLRIEDRFGRTIQEFAYDDAPGWPTGADGGGFSLQIVDPYGPGDQASNWRASSSVGGSPGIEDVPKPAFLAIVKDDGTIRLLIEARRGQAYRVQWNDRLTAAGWQPLSTVPAPGTDQTIEVLDTWLPPLPCRYYRITTP